MPRDPALRPLSRQHNIALVFAKSLRQWREAEPDAGERRAVAEATLPPRADPGRIGAAH